MQGWWEEVDCYSEVEGLVESDILDQLEHIRTAKRMVVKR